jgi:large subunit ribosomal protein L6
LADELNLLHNIYKKKKIKKIKNKFNVALRTLKEVQTSAITGYKRTLRVKGVGYKFNLNMDHHIVTVEVGYSYFLQACFDTEFDPTLHKKSIELEVQSNNLLRLTTFLSKIRKLRPPDVYKGKGIRYRKDSVR